MNKNKTVVLLLVLAAGCSSKPQEGAYAPPMDPTRKVSEQDCSRPIDTDRGNLMCREVTEAERRAKIAEEERQARARREAEERAARERLERERAEQLAREEAARKQRAAEEERLAAERRRLEAEAARKAQEERERQERAEAEARARQRAEQEAREARQRAEQEAREVAERECRRLEQERLDGRALLANFVANYGKVEENKGIAGQITAFLDKARKVKPCPPALKAQRAALSGVDGVRAPSPTTNFAFGLRASFVS
jgi:dTMP kinase